MQLFLNILLLMTFSQSFAEEKKVEGIQDVHKKYCEQKVEDACDALKPQAAQVQFQFNNEQVANVQKLLGSVEKQCGSSEDCKIREVEKIANNVIQEMKQKCTQGDKEACYQNEIYELQGQGRKSSP
jgi:hypothetical protein